jgi:hypothetical protein
MSGIGSGVSVEIEDVGEGSGPTEGDEPAQPATPTITRTAPVSTPLLRMQQR